MFHVLLENILTEERRTVFSHPHKNNVSSTKRKRGSSGSLFANALIWSERDEKYPGEMQWIRKSIGPETQTLNRNRAAVLYANYSVKRFIGETRKRPAGIRDCVEDEGDRSLWHRRRLWFARRSIKRKRLRRRYNAFAELRYLSRYVNRLPSFFFFPRNLCIF